MKTALNRITMPNLPLMDFLTAAKEMGFNAVEVRNDLPGGKILGGLNPKEVKRLAKELAIDIITINALQRFNDRKEFISDRVEELKEMVTIAKEAGITAVILCPVNDLDESRTHEQRMEDTIYALKAYGPIFKAAGVLGYLEPLGFVQCSLRFKKDAVSAIKQSGYLDCYKLVHDTFHHYLAGEKDLFPEMTGLIHMSGVVSDKKVSSITDADRILVTKDDVMANKAQLDALLDSGYNGYCAFECFSPEVQKLKPSVLAKEIQQSVAFLLKR